MSDLTPREQQHALKMAKALNLVIIQFANFLDLSHESFDDCLGSFLEQLEDIIRDVHQDFEGSTSQLGEWLRDGVRERLMDLYQEYNSQR